MVVCDIGRASMLLALSFVENLAGLVLVSFALEILTLLWGPAKDASVPQLVRPDQLQSANTSCRAGCSPSTTPSSASAS
jgi:dTMP kinase